MSPFESPALSSEYVFQSAYTGAVKSASPPQIHDMLRKLRIEIGAVEAKKSEDKFGPKFPVRGAKDLAQKLANALNTLNMEAPVIAQEITLIDTDKIPANERQSGSPVFRTLAHVKSTVRIIAPDTSFIDVVGSGHGGDVDDKSGGKASTFAWKDAILKGLCIPHEDMVDTDDDSSISDGESSAIRGADYSGRKASSKDASRAGAGRGKGASGQVSESPTSVEASTNSVSDRLAVESEDSDEKGLAYVLKAIAEADTDTALEQIRAAVKSGVLALHGADRLAATSAFMARKEKLKKGE